MFNTGVTQVKRPLVASLPTATASPHIPWRKTGFRTGPLFHSGVLDLSPGWFQAAHEVSAFSCAIFVAHQ
jgi:hypothetical protein